MKSILRLLCVLFIALPLFLIGCSYDEDTIPTITDENVDSLPSTLVEPATIESLMPHLELLDSFYGDTYGAEIDWDHPYSRVFESEEAFANGESPIAIIPRVIGEDFTVPYTNDPVSLSLYVIENFSSLAEWREYLLQYMAPEFAEIWGEREPDVFYTYNEKLYFAYAPRGYGMYSLDFNTAKLIYADGNKCSATVDLYFFDNYESTLKVDFEWVDGKWVIFACD